MGPLLGLVGLRPQPEVAREPLRRMLRQGEGKDPAKDREAVANAIGQKLLVAKAATEKDIETAFATLAEQHVDAVLRQQEQAEVRGD